MGIIGCGMLFTSLVLGALSGSVGICLITMGIGFVFIGGALIREHQKEQQEQAWRKEYPSYRY